MNYKIKFTVISLVFILISACNNKPKVISPSVEDNSSNGSSVIFSESSSSQNVDFNKAPSTEFHKVVVNEVLPTKKYVYLNVTEADDKFWIATGKTDVKVGETYLYRGGLLKTNFESKEYNRVFKKVYLVTKLVPENHGNNTDKVNVNDYTVTNLNDPEKVAIETHTDKVVLHKGSIRIADLVNNPKKYSGKTIQLNGICTKINAGIMNRNWIHIKDGSKDDFDLVITSDAFVPEGSAFTIKVLVTLNKDFGAGYKYDLILENGVVIK